MGDTAAPVSGRRHGRSPRARCAGRVALAGLAILASAAVYGGDVAPGLSIRYLGASGLSLRHGDDHVLTAPFFSNPGKWRAALARIRMTEDRFPPYLDELAADARALLVGHAHYDHLMDVPGVAQRLPADAVIYANRTAAHILAAVSDLPVRVETVDGRAGDSTRVGEWIEIPGQRVRFMPLRSGHAPQLRGVRLFDGQYQKDLARLPRRAKGWRMGQPLSFVIDFLGPGKDDVRFRLFYQDTATEAPAGFPPPLDDGNPFDVAVLCVASFARVRDHPEAILERLRPRAVVLTHWESFFRPQSAPIRPVPATDVDRFVERLEAALPDGVRYWKPAPGEAIRLP